MELITMKLSQIKPYPNNPRQNNEAVKAVMESIQQCTYIAPIIVDEDNVILAGHTRYKAMKKLGWKECEVIVKEGLNEEQKRKYRLLDNKTSELADWDFDMLAVELEGLDFGDLDLDWGIDEPQEETEVVEDDYDEEPPTEPKAKRGDIYQLGRHRLMCGDSTSSVDVQMLIGGVQIDLVFTDPPYGIDIVKSGNVGGDNATHFGTVRSKNIVKCNNYIPIANDDTTDAARENFLITKKLSKNQIIFGGNYFTDFLETKSCWIVWDKENTGNFADVELAWTSFDKGAKLYKWLWNGLCRKGERAVEGVKRVHPTQKPVGLIADILKDFSKEDENILDCFGGSGSTLIACEQIGRNCFMMECEPHYIDVIIDRWETFTGEQAVLIHAGEN